MKSIRHYIFWIGRDIARAVLRIRPFCLWLSRHDLKTYLSLFYFDWTGKRINWDDPSDFNQWLLKVSYNNSKSENRFKIAKCVDKYGVRDYVESCGYAPTLNELYGVYDNVDAIDFDSLPTSFVMKMNNASGRNLICPDKSMVNWPVEKEKFRVWLKDRDFGLLSGEWQYSLIEPKIVVEKYLSELDESSLIDYKFNCINGKVYSCFVGYNRNPADPHHEVCFDDYDLEWTRTESIKPEWHKDRRLIQKPSNYDLMVKMAEDMTEGFDYCRFDVYEVDGRLYFGEMTFTPQGCILEFYTDKFLLDALSYANRGIQE